jgi:hypothetical protein
MKTEDKSPGKPEKPEIVIHIDKTQYRAPKSPMTGAELRALGAVGSDYDLWQKVPGKDDLLVDPATVIELKNGDHFYTAPGTLNPGGW